MAHYVNTLKVYRETQRQMQRDERQRDKVGTAELAPAKSIVVMNLLLHVDGILHQFLYTSEMSLTGGHLLQSTDRHTRANIHTETNRQAYRH